MRQRMSEASVNSQSQLHSKLLHKKKTGSTPVFFLSDETQISVNNGRRKADNFILQDPFGDIIVQINLLTKTEGIIHLQKSSAANIVRRAMFFEIEDKCGIVLSDDVAAMFQHARFPFRVPFLAAILVFGERLVETIGQSYGMPC